MKLLSLLLCLALAAPSVHALDLNQPPYENTPEPPGLVAVSPPPVVTVPLIPFLSFRYLAAVNEQYAAMFLSYALTDEAVAFAQRALTFTLIADFLGESPTP